MANSPKILDRSSRAIMRALDADPRATVGWLAERLGLARGTVQSRIGTLFAPGALRPISTLVRPESLGFAVRALVSAEVDQSRFETAMESLSRIPEVLECHAISGETDLYCQVVARDAGDLYRIGQLILASPGIRRTATSLVLKDLIEYRTAQLLVDPDD